MQTQTLELHDAPDSDASLLRELAADPILLTRARAEAHEAYTKARGQDGCQWQALDDRWNALTNSLHRNFLVSIAANPGSRADNAARAASLRAAREAREAFLAYKAPAQVTNATVPTALLAQRLSGKFDEALEAGLASGTWPKTEKPALRMVPLVPTQPARSHVRTRRSI